MSNAKPIREDYDPDDVEIHWQHPRHALESPVLLVWPGGLRDKWAAEVNDDGVAWVVSHTTLYKTDGGDVESVARSISPNEAIPEYVALTLLNYDGKYGPVEKVANDYPEPDPGADEDGTDSDQKRLTEG